MVLSETKPPARPEGEEGIGNDLMPLPDVSDELHQPFNPGIQQAPVSNYATPTTGSRMSPEAVLAGALVMLVVLAIGAFFIYRLAESKQNAIAVANTPPPAPATMPIRIIVVPAPKPISTAPIAPIQSAPTKPAVDPRASDEDWKKVDEAHRMAAPPVAILAYDDYLSRHPDTEWKKDLNAYTNDALDRIWWQRLKEVITQQADLHKQLAPLEAHLKELNSTSSDPKRKQELTDQIADLKKQLKDLETEQFVTMKYTRAEVPDIYDSAQLDALRKERDPASYEAWKKEVLTSIRKTRGSLPW
jgi:DNA-binding transcriptional MerR regulator